MQNDFLEEIQEWLRAIMKTTTSERVNTLQTLKVAIFCSSSELIRIKNTENLVNCGQNKTKDIADLRSYTRIGILGTEQLLNSTLNIKGIILQSCLMT